MDEFEEKILNEILGRLPISRSDHTPKLESKTNVFDGIQEMSDQELMSKIANHAREKAKQQQVEIPADQFFRMVARIFHNVRTEHPLNG